MKKITYIFLSVILLSSVSCSDTFTEVAPDGSNADNYFNSEEEYQSALTGAYDLL